MKRLLWIALVLSLISVSMLPIVSYAANSATQNASTKNVTAISIKAQDYQTDISTITFPKGTPGSTVENPRNDINSSSPQTFGDAGDARPVATLVNTDTTYEYYIYYNISSWTNSVVSSEYYLINEKGAACSSGELINKPVIFNTVTNSGVTIGPNTGYNGSKKDLYLKVTLGNTGGLSGNSNITILAEPN